MRFRVFTFIVCVLLISSCTIQKRIYRPGWNISFRGSLKSNLKSPVESSFETNSIKTTDEKIVEEFPEKMIEQADDNEADFNNFINKEKEHPIKSKVRLNQLQENLVDELSQFKRITFFKIKQEKNASKSSRTMILIPLVLLSVGLIILAFGLLVYFSTNIGIYSVFSSVIGVLGIVIGGLILLIALLMLLITLITLAVIKNEQRIKEQSQTTEKTPANQPNLEIEKSDVKNETPIEVTPEPTKKTENNTKGLITIGAVVAAFTLIYLLIKQ